MKLLGSIALVLLWVDLIDSAGYYNPPTYAPATDAPTDAPTYAPTTVSIAQSTNPPTDAPTDTPTNAPTDAPTNPTTDTPTDAPTDPPTDPPTNPPITNGPTSAPFSCRLNTGRIIGGTEAGVGFYPYQVSLRRSASNGQSGHFCGGSILDNQWILTAAQCVIGQDSNSMFIVVGTNFLDAGGNAFAVDAIVPHPEFDPVQLTNNVALVRVNNPIQFSPTVQPIALATVAPSVENMVIATGWGFTNPNTTDIPNALQNICLRVISTAECAQSWPDVSQANVCTLNLPGQGMCGGDTGGPLVTLNRQQQVGVVSFGPPNCANGLPDAYTSVPNFLMWIQSETNVGN